MELPFSDDRCINAARRFHRRLGISPREIFTPPPELLSSSPNASSFTPRRDLYPPPNVGWSIGLLDDLSALAYDAQAQPPPPQPHSTAQQQTQAADNFLLGIRVSRALINAIDMRIKRQTRTTGKGAATATHFPEMSYLTCEDVDTVRTSRAYEGDEDEDEDGQMGEEEEDVEEKIHVGAGHEEAKDSLEDQHTDEEGDMINDQDDEGSKDSPITRDSNDPPRNQNMGNGSVDKEPSLPSSPSSPAGAVAHAQPHTNIQDERVALVNPASEASLLPLNNTTSTATAGAKAVTNATARGDTGTIKDIGINGTRQSQSSSCNIVPAVSTPTPVSGRPTPLTALRSHNSPGHTPPATSSQPLSVANKRPRLSSHESGHVPSADQHGSSDAQANLVGNQNGIATMHVVGMSSESGPSQQHLRLDNPDSKTDNEELFTIDNSATKLQARISHQRALNAEYEKTIAQEGQISSGASKLIKTHQVRLIAAENAIERRAALQETFEHALDGLIKEDAMDPIVDDLKRIVSSHKALIERIRTEIQRMENNLASTKEKWRCSQKDQATAAEHLEQGTKMTGSMVAKYNAVVTKKRRWDQMADCVHTRPDEASPAVDGHSIATEDLHKARMDKVAHDEQDAAP